MKRHAGHLLRLEALEERIFFDANPTAVIIDPSDSGGLPPSPDAASIQTEAASPPGDQGPGASDSTDESPAETGASDTTPSETGEPEAKTDPDEPEATTSQAPPDPQEPTGAEETAAGETATEEPATTTDQPTSAEVTEETAAQQDPAAALEETAPTSPTGTPPSDSAALDDAGPTETDSPSVQDDPTLAESALTAPLETTPAPITQVVFIDNSIHDFETLNQGFSADINQTDTAELTLMVSLDGSADEIQQITDTLDRYSNLTAIHIVSHGSEGSLSLGSTTLTSATLADYADSLQRWGTALDGNGDILLYGCTIGKDGEGQDFIDSLADLTGADIAASTDASGNSAAGGNWQLEAASGSIETVALLDAGEAWPGLLAPPDPESSATASATGPMLNSDFTIAITIDNDPSASPTADPGYAPFVDVVIPKGITVGSPTVGGSGVAAPYQVFTWDGTDNRWETASGAAVTEHPFNSTTPPVALAMPSATQTGDKWYVVSAPFGSFTKDQPATQITFTGSATAAAGAQPGVPLDITYKAGFQYGDSATNAHGPLQEDGAANVLTITPQVIDIHKTNDLSEGQTVTGPNYPVTYTLRVDIAPGTVVEDVWVDDYLPQNAVFRGDVSITGIPSNGTGILVQPAAWTILDGVAGHRLLRVDLGDLTGLSGASSEFLIRYSVYFDKVNATGGSLLGAGGADGIAQNEASVTGLYIKPDLSKLPVADGKDLVLGQINDNENATNSPSDNQIQIASIVTDKTVVAEGGAPYKPGTILQYTIEVDIADTYAASAIILEDLYGDGQSLYTAGGHNPSIVVHENGVNTASTAFALANYTLGAISPTTGKTPLTFNVSGQLVSMGQDGILTGGGFASDTAAGDSIASHDASLNGRRTGDATYATITYYTRIDDDYDYLQDPPTGTNDASVDIGDTVANEVTVHANMTDGTAVPVAQEDGSTTLVTIAGGNVSKTIYKVNGADYSGAGVKPGDEITYRLTMTVPLANFENLVIKDYLPLPVFLAGELTQTADDFDGGSLLVGGNVEFGPSHNLNGTHVPGLLHNETSAVTTALPPTVSTDAANNSLILNFGSYDVPTRSDNPSSVTIDVLLTVTVRNEAMADQLALINQSEWSFNNTTNQSTDSTATQPIVLNNPEIHITKGVVAQESGAHGSFSAALGPTNLTVDPATGAITISGDGDIEANDIDPTVSGAVPIDANLSGIDGGDLVTFALTVYNTGGSNAYGISLKDTIPTGFIKPADAAALNLKVYRGNSSTAVAGGYTLALAPGGDQFTLVFDNTLASALAGNRGDGNGQDVYLITYQLTADSSAVDDPGLVIAGSTQTNTATVDFYTGQVGQTTDWTIKFGEPTDTATVSIARPSITKSLIGTGIDDGISGSGSDEAGVNEALEAVIGETVSYEVRVAVPEGQTPDFQLVDLLDAGLGLRQIDSIEFSAGLTSTNIVSFTSATPVTGPGGFYSYTENPTGQDRLTINFGTLTNSADSNAATEYVTVRYTALVLNTAGNQSTALEFGPNLNNQAHGSWTVTNSDATSSTTTTANASAGTVALIEPALDTVKYVQINGGALTNGTVTGDSGDPIIYTITLKQRANTEANAYEVSLSDPLPAQIHGASLLSVTDSAGPLDINDFSLSGDDTIGYTLSTIGNFDFAYNTSRTITITIDGTLATGLSVNSLITNTATTTWSSLDDTTNTNLSGFITTGDSERDGSGGINNYLDTDPASIRVGTNSVSKILVNSEISDEANATADGGLVAANPGDGVNRGREVTIGEKLTYQVTITLAEGISGNVHLLDSLDQGLALVSIDGITASSSDLSIANLAALQTAIGTSGITGPLGGLVGYTFNSGGTDQLDINLGTITNANTTNAVAETITITYTAMATDIAANTSITPALDNSARISWTGGTSAANSADSVEIIEPKLTVDKSVVPDHGDAGDPITYTITIAHAVNSEATAYDLSLSDLLPGDLTNMIISGASGAGLTTTDFAIVGGVLQFAINGDPGRNTIDLEKSQAISLTLTGDIANTVQSGQVITNEAQINWTSINGARSNHSGFVPGANIDDRERGYTAQDDAEISNTNLPTIDKTGSGSYTIGQEVTYDIKVTLPEGITRGLKVYDALPVGLRYTGYSIDYTHFDGPDIVPTLTPSSAGDGDDLTFDFDSGNAGITLPGGSGANNYFTIHVTAVATNITTNYGDPGGSPTVLVNEASLSFVNADNNTITIDDPTDPSITIVEPIITTTKDIQTVIDPALGVLPGQPLTYTVKLHNTGTSTAYEVTALDSLPAGVQFLTGTASAQFKDNSDATVAVTDNGSTLSFSSTAGGGWDIAVDDWVTISYQVQVTWAGYVVGSHTNTVDADWTGRDGGHTTPGDFERVYDDGISQQQWTVDRTQDQDPATFEVLSNPPSLGDTVFFDVDGDGLQGRYDSNGDGVDDTDEPGIGGVQINLYNKSGLNSYLLLATTTTDSTGFYQFANLPLTIFSGPYRVEVDAATLPPGLTQVYENPIYNTNDPDADPTNNRSVVDVLDIATDIYDVDFGYQGHGIIGDYVWFDANHNRQQDDPIGTGIANAKVVLTSDFDGDGSIDLTLTTHTDSNGGYSFNFLRYAQYQITVTPPSGPGYTDQTFDPDGIYDNTTLISLDASKQIDRTADFGYAGTGSIGDLVWNDVNFNGNQDAGEPGLAGINLSLIADINQDGTDDFTLTATTATDGSYSFTGLPAGNYRVRVDSASLPSGMIASADPDTILDHTTTLTLSLTDLSLPMIRADIDFGYTATGSIGDRVWYDYDNDGVQDSNEVGLAGVKVSLAGDVDLDGIIDNRTTTTGADGLYTFTNLPGGTYTLAIDTGSLPGGMTQTFDLDGTGSANTTAVGLTAGQNRSDADFGYTGTGSIGDTVWNDVNRNGIIDPGEQGIGGVEMAIGVDLTGDGRADFTAQTTTAADGSYLFAHLPAGSHLVTVNTASLPPGLTPSFDPDGSLDGSFSVLLGAGENRLDADFGYAQPLSPETSNPPDGSLPPTLPPGPPPGPPLRPITTTDPFLWDTIFGPRPSGLQEFLDDPSLFDRGDSADQGPVLLVAPIYSGHAEPGTTIALRLYDANENLVGYQTVIADSGGNWLANFDGILLDELPHLIEIDQTMATYNGSTAGGFNMRTYFCPAFGAAPFTRTSLTIGSIFATLPGTVFSSIKDNLANPNQLGWNDFDSYEFLAPSTNPAENHL